MILKTRGALIIGQHSETSETTAGVLPIYDRTIVSSQSLQYDFS